MLAEEIKRTINDMQKITNDWEKQRAKLTEQIKAMRQSIDAIYKAHDVCPHCDGDKEIFDADGYHGDPHGKKWEYTQKCPSCGGTGKYCESSVQL